MIAALILLAEVAAPIPKTGPVEHLKKRVVEAIRNCPGARPGEVVVCAPDRGIAEGYRIPKLDPRFASGALRASGRGEVKSGVGAAGVGSCSQTGSGGEIGCARRDYETWGAERRRQRAENPE